MATEQSIQTLRRIRRRYVQAKLWLYALQAAAAMVVGIVVLYRWGFEAPVLAFTAVSLTLGAILYLALRWRQINKTSLQQVARHLNRQYPQLEDSAELLLQEPHNLLQRLQQQKIASTLQELHPEKEKTYALRPAPSYLALGLALVLSAGILYLPAAPLVPGSSPPEMKVAFPDAPAPAGDTATVIEGVEVSITPPAYTGKKAYQADNLSLRIEEGANVTWRVRTNKPAHALQLELSGETPEDFTVKKNEYTFSRRFTTPTLYTINLNGKQSAFYTVELVPDEAPLIQLERPEQYTEIRLGEPQRVKLLAQLSDDYGIRDANMVATVAKGSGEAVKFREEKIKLDLKGNSRSYKVSQTLDLQKLGMSFGDELYFYLQAWDKQQGYTRSDVYFVQIEDTTIVEAAFDMSMGVNPVPEYFRSQRQIIIDTEKLIKEQNSISRAEFEERSNNIGVDQKLLRLRYGKFLGEEFESGIGPGGGIPEGEEGHEEAQHFSGDGHDHPEFEDKNSPDALLSPYMHKHDQEGEATIFEPAVKAKLKGALAQMWEAELRLRTHKPKEALPYEYKALRMLKDVQQSTRAYVAKTGFEAPPLKEPELRLTGELHKITPPSEKQQVEKKPQFPHTRAALNWLEGYKQHGQYKQADAQVLERAGQELAQQTLNRPGGYLRPLQDLRTLISDIQSKKKLCATCLASVEHAWATLLPPTAQTPQQKTTSRSQLSREYFKQLNQP
ncbi:hypothetical protein CLV24_103126 [Pontibacter ummariensis]|uniref:DUF4175 domain-containing protein n=1 Tax=Pontibacter ummariensis TaxID=1610492 RepID=A0A239CQX2_9BACT|nr:DUF4175 family protein [Pontibacter ummariensis]PRY14889.1 hypothetical protein CLV24_103126 [Pontibacter ummariensis]SNS22252.1 hypothetical protein SAMN06296052_103187 [Pontibacter ummariensis]